MLQKILLVAFITCICNNINATDIGNSIDHEVTTQQYSFKKNSSNNNKDKNNYYSNNGSTIDTKKIQSGIHNEKIGDETDEFKNDFVEQNILANSDKTYDN